MSRGRCAVLARAGIWLFSLTLGVQVLAESRTVDLANDPFSVRFHGVLPNDGTGVEAAACDVNADGVGDLVVGATNTHSLGGKRLLAGEAYLLLGRRGAWRGGGALRDAASTTIYGGFAFDSLGEGMACADINGDGYDDMILGAANHLGPGGTEHSLGAAFVVFGRPHFPAVIDLEVDPHTEILGAARGDTVGYYIATGDLNGDGTSDVVMQALFAPNAMGVGEPGRVYVLFGRRSWPPRIRVNHGGVTVVGDEAPGKTLSGSVAATDLDGDGYDELLMVSRLSPGWAGVPDRAGRILAFRGRPAWPEWIDLAHVEADMIVYGVDEDDQIGRDNGVVGTDLDGDGQRELLVSSALARDEPGEVVGRGELRRVEFEAGEALPDELHLAFRTDSLVRGAGARDFFSLPVGTANLLDGPRADLVLAGSGGDGPDETREDAGEVVVIAGRFLFPESLDLETEAPDLVIYGAEAGDALVSLVAVDINGDGRDELVLASSQYSHERVSTIWIVAPHDGDGDSLVDLADNCPLLWNPDQSDGNENGIGDACEGDYDGDGLGDETDCAPNLAAGGTPGSVHGLRLRGRVRTVLRWDPAAFATDYDISRGLLSAVDWDDYGACHTAHDVIRQDERFDELEAPGPGDGFFYLVRARNHHCGLVGSFGVRGDGSERVNGNPGSCP